MKTPSRENIRDGVRAHRITSHAADIANDQPEARDWDDALSEARYEFNWRRQFDLAFDPEQAQEHRDQTLPGDNYEEARFCSMRGVKFFSMRISQDAQEANEEMTAISNETDLEASSAAEVNISPVGDHDTSHVLRRIEINGITFTPAGSHADD